MPFTSDPLLVPILLCAALAGASACTTSAQGSTFGEHNTRRLHKGELRAGQRALVHIGSIGSQYTLYMPPCWLHPGANTLTSFNLQADAPDPFSTVREPVFGATACSRD